MENKPVLSYGRSLAWIILLFLILPALNAQMLADFETPAKTPYFHADDTAYVVDNPDKSGINTSEKAGYYNKIAGNWHFVALEFPDTVKIRFNNTLTFKLRTSTQGRIFAKFWLGTDVVIENWAPNWNFKPAPYTWVECEMDMTPAMGMQFNKLHLAACVDNDAAADVWFDDVKLSNSEAGDGTPRIEFSVSDARVITGEQVSFNAAESYDYDGEIMSYHWDFGDGTADSGITVTHIYVNDSIYYPTLTITDNDGKSVMLSETIFVFSATCKLSDPSFLTDVLKTNEKIEVRFQVNDDYSNPYDPDEVMTDAVVTCPEGDSLLIPCFYYVPATYKDGDWITDDSKGVWMLRFISGQAGPHLLKLNIHDSDGFTETSNFSFVVEAGKSKGIIRADTANKQYYRHTTGEPFYPLGINIGWNDLENYTLIINNLSGGGANIFRYWHTPFARQALEWEANYFYDGLGQYSQKAAAMSDSLLELCEEVDVYMQLVLFQHGMFSENVDEMWTDNPYNTLNDGFVDRAEEYFYNDGCKTQTRKLLRYIIARWAWSKNLFAWEFFNEVQFTGIHNSQTSAWFPGVLRWHSEMSRYVESIDPWDHIRTTSASNDQLASLDTISALDNLQYHLYTGESTLLESQGSLDYRFRDELVNCSVINGEYGTSTGADTPFDMQRHAIWNGIMTQVPRYMWIWSHYLQTSWAGLFSMPAMYLSSENFAEEEDLQYFEVICTHPTRELKSYGLTTGSKYYGYIYDPDNGTDISGGRIMISDLPVASYDITWFLPVTGEVICQDSVAPVFWSNTLELPEFSKGLAFKMTYRAEYNAPFARAGNDTVIPMDGVAYLSAAMSSSKVSDTLTFLWRITDKPLTSQVSLSDSTSMVIEVTPDVPGIYTLSLTVNDGELDSRPDEVRIRLSAPPVAVAGNDTTVYLSNEYLRLNGAASYDPDGEKIIYQWVLISVPEGSQGTIAGGTESGQVTLMPDITGWYIIELTVNDGLQNSLPDTVAVDVIITTGAQSIHAERYFQVFPNPAAGSLFIVCPGNEELDRIEIFDQEGRLLMSEVPRMRVQGIYNIGLPENISGQHRVLLRITGTRHKECKQVMLMK
jgi:PKD repeat protein